MTRTFITPAEGEELKQLIAEFRALSRHSMAVLARKGMDAPEFLDADQAIGSVYRRIKEIHGTTNRHWMHS